MANADAYCPGCGALARWHDGVVACGRCAKAFTVWSKDAAPPAPDVLPYAGKGVQRKPGIAPADRWAVRAVWFAVFWWVLPLMPIGAVWAGLKSMARYPRGARYAGRKRAIISVILGVLTLFVAWPWLWVQVSAFSAAMADMNCGMQAREIGQLTSMYQSEHHRMPEHLPEGLNIMGEHGTRIACPSDSARWKRALTGTLNELPWEQQSSYVYIGQGIPRKILGPAWALPLVFEPMPPHERPMLLFMDGHGERPEMGLALEMIQAAEDRRVWRAAPPATQEAP